MFFLLYKTNRFHVAVRLFSASVSLMFLPHFDVLCDLLLNRRTATWNLFVKQTHGNMESTCYIITFR